MSVIIIAVFSNPGKMIFPLYRHKPAYQNMALFRRPDSRSRIPSNQSCVTTRSIRSHSSSSSADHKTGVCCALAYSRYPQPAAIFGSRGSVSGGFVCLLAFLHLFPPSFPNSLWRTTRRCGMYGKFLAVRLCIDSFDGAEKGGSKRR